MPTDLFQLTTAFSGAQLIAFVYVLLELRRISEAQKTHATQSAAQAEKVADLSEKLAKVIGQLESRQEKRN